jgi:hypothetical protein
VGELKKYSTFEELKESENSTEVRSKEEQEKIEKRHVEILEFLKELRKNIKK